MTTRLTQKAFRKGTREFEIIDDAVFVRIKSLFREEKSSVALSTLDPEPVLKGAELAFFSRYHGRPVLSLLVNKPNAAAFDSFVATLKQRILAEGSDFSDAEPAPAESSRPPAPGWNVYDEPPEFDESDAAREKISFQAVNAARLSDDIAMLKTYLNQADLEPLLDALDVLAAQPHNAAAFEKVVAAFNELGMYQGAVLTYAPYLKVLLSKSFW